MINLNFCLTRHRTTQEFFGHFNYETFICQNLKGFFLPKVKILLENHVCMHACIHAKNVLHFFPYCSTAMHACVLMHACIHGFVCMGMTWHIWSECCTTCMHLTSKICTMFADASVRSSIFFSFSLSFVSVHTLSFSHVTTFV